MLNDWCEIKTQYDFAIHRRYSDGTDVIISIRAINGCYEVWSSAEHRTSGPNNHLDGGAESIESAKKLLWTEAKGWDDDLVD
jgi:hypothetical protein